MSLHFQFIKNFLYTLQGIEHVQISGYISPMTFKNSLDYEPDDTDIFVNSFTKCGTTWLQMIVHLMKNNLQSPETLEEKIEEMEKPRQIKTHFPFELVPFNPNTKYIYITRNPFDCCVSLFHHHRAFYEYEFDGTFDEFFEMFLRGEDDPNIHFMLYEDLKNNPEDEIVKLGRFLGGKYEQDVMNKDFVKEVIEKSNFKTMSKFTQMNSEELQGKVPSKFIRKGVIGDYKNMFSESQFERLYERYSQELSGTTLEKSWTPFINKMQNSKTITGHISPITFKNSLDYEPDDSDIFINSFPKCGTTWLQMIVHLMKNNLQSPEKSEEQIEEMEKPRQIKTHFPFELVPFNPKTKYIYITRNPFDCCVSLFHHHRILDAYEFDGTFDEFFEMFLRGEDDPNIHFMLYEDLKNNPEDEIVRLGRFLGGKYEQDVMNKDFVKEVIEKSNFKTMSKFVQKNSEERKSKIPAKFIRKGVIGDYRNIFSENDPNIHFMLYEDLKNNPEDEIVRLGRFLGGKYEQDVMNKDFVKEVIEKRRKSEVPAKLIRKGVIGDYKNMFSKSQFERLFERFSQDLSSVFYCFKKLPKLPKDGSACFIKHFMYTLQGIEHVQINGYTNPVTFKNSLDYEPDDTDIFVNSFPKCGTTWLQMIVWLMKNNLQSPEKLEDLTLGNYLGITATKEKIEEMEKPRQIKTHFPFELVPFNPNTKYIYITRNPFDCCVSLFHHHRAFPEYEFDGNFDEFFEMFLRGEVDFGNYFHNVKSWYEHKDDPNIHFMLYEDLKSNPEDEIVRLGRFLGGKYEQDVMNKDFVKEVIEKSNFKTMSKFAQKNSEGRKSEVPAKLIRKGVIGDYKNMFSKSQFERLFESPESHKKLMDYTHISQFIKNFLYTLQGIEHVQIAGYTSPMTFKNSLDYEPDDTDIFVNSYLKCGTTWLQMIVWLMKNNLQSPEKLEEVDFGNYFHNVKSWYEHKDDPNIHFMLYEDLKNNPEDEIVKLGRFLGGKYEQDVMNKDFVKEVIEKSNFKTMSKFAQKNSEGRKSAVPAKLIRKGVIGDYKNMFSKSQFERLFERYSQELSGTTLEKAWTPFINKIIN
ncbi:Sulfotransferase 1C4 [Nymphon striatum]|nr:Sulfotransferase 1C4 [Nymphon striatum]